MKFPEEYDDKEAIKYSDRSHNKQEEDKMIEGAQRTSLIRLAGFTCMQALCRSQYGKRKAAIVSTRPLVKMNIPHSEIANNLPKALQPFDIVPVDDILNKRIPDVIKGGMVVTGYSDKFLRDDINIRNIMRQELRNDGHSIESGIQDRIRSICINQRYDLDSGRLWFLILSETLPHGEALEKYCWWGYGPFYHNSAVSEIRYSEQEPDKIDLVNFSNTLGNKWAKTGKVSFSATVLDQ